MAARALWQNDETAYGLDDAIDGLDYIKEV